MTQEDYRQMPPPNTIQQTSSLAVISLIAGIASYVIVPLLGAITAIITGSMAKKEIRQSSGRLSGIGLANGGVILGWINIAFSIIAGCLMFLIITGVITLGVFALFTPSSW